MNNNWLGCKQQHNQWRAVFPVTVHCCVSEISRSSATLVADECRSLVAAAAAAAARASICHNVTDSISQPPSQPVCLSAGHLSPALQRHASSHLCRIHLHQLLLLLDLGCLSGRRRTALEGNQRYDLAAFIYEQSVKRTSPEHSDKISRQWRHATFANRYV